VTALPQKLEGIIPPVCTPFTEDYQIDVPSLERLIGWFLDAGVNGLFMLGSTSEVAVLTSSQRRQVLDVAVRVTGGKVPIFAGTIDTSTARVIENARCAQEAGIDGLVVTAPFYIKVSQPEIVDHFRAVHAAVPLPILAYDIPGAVQVKLDRKTVLHLAKEGTIAGIKDSSGDESNFRGLVIAGQDIPGFSIFTGSELLVDNAIMEGADGSVPGLGNVDPKGYVKLYQLLRNGDFAAARAEQDRLYRLFSIVYCATPGRMGFTASALGGFKSALILRGIIATNVLGQPMARYTDEEVARVREILVETGLL
jgi:4-hydroxy-tetrahydrodipicolinate synthase